MKWLCDLAEEYFAHLDYLAEEEARAEAVPTREEDEMRTIVPAQPGFTQLQLWQGEGEHFVCRVPIVAWDVKTTGGRDPHYYAVPVTFDEDPRGGSGLLGLAIGIPSGAVIVPHCAEYDSEEDWVEAAMRSARRQKESAA